MKFPDIAFSVEGLSKRFPNGVEAVKDLTLSVERGQIVGLLGPNGSGKTTTINLLTTTFKPTSGQGQVLGFDLVRESHKIRRLIGLVPQYETIDWSLTVDQNLKIFANLLGIPHATRRVGELLELLELDDKRYAPIEQLSGGQIRRVQLARGILFPAPLLFVDEPTIGLDPVGVNRVLDFLKLQASEGKTVVLASNIMEEIQNICDRIVFLNQGRITYDGPPADFVRYWKLPERVIIQAKNPPPSALLRQIEQAGLQVLELVPLKVSGVNAGSATVTILAPFLANGYQLENLTVVEPTLRDAFLAFAHQETGEVVFEH